MKFTRRKFLKISALVCTAPVINKIDGIASVNVDSCVPEIMPSVNWNAFDNVSPLEIFREVAEKLIRNGHIKTQRYYS